MKIDIGAQIQVSHRGEVITGRIVGVEDAGNRRGFPAGRLYHVQLPDWDGAREVHESQLILEQLTH